MQTKMEEKTKTFEEHGLYHRANEYRKLMTEEDELEDIDMTTVFLKELDSMIEKGEIIIININAKMRLGKSTLAMAIGKHIFKLLKKHGYRKKGERFGMKNIARDHQEHSKMMRDPETQFTVIVTDESNELENTGENVTVEQALAKVFSDVQAGRYVHRVCCSPKETIDANADILLNVTAIDKQTMTTHAKLYYRFFEGANEYVQLLGYIRFGVGDIIGTWEKESKKLFYKIKRGIATKKEKEEFEKLKKKDWYTNYYIKKHEKMELITNEGIFKPRLLDYAEAIITVVDKLRKLTKLGNIINKNIISNYVKQEFRRRKIPTSIVGDELATRETMGILDTWKAFYKVSKDLIILDTKLKMEKIDQETYELQSEPLLEIQKDLLRTAKVQEDELKRYAEISKKYRTIE